MDTIEVELAQGLFRNGVFHRSSKVAPLTGRAESDLRDSVMAQQSNADVATRLLATSVGAIGALSPLTTEDMADLTVGDRERLLFALYRASLGSRIDVLATCWQCEEVCELDIAAQVAPPHQAPAQALHHLDYERDDAAWRIGFRLPTGRDQADLASAASEGRDDAEMLLLRRCMVGATCNGQPVEAVEPDEEMLAAFGEYVRHADLAAEGIVRFACPACGAGIEVLIDAMTILRGALMDGQSILLDVHRLARTYHWTEREILALTGNRRRDYLALIEEEEQA
ncbi:hypothetical protein [Sinorhizobium sp. BG8]|uniref:T4 family baseplate hub assembly chaperone n=1 Tax=Sinorhizobium sp. BG8 TaxID=2613773 RepID=UPI00193D83A8|nr:hypothetical protein [Sinorhizobium sp. BG8]QRM54379.1 hypothetical protein F3Y30_07330 [Sinorhizobium sp. BG8]